MQGFQHASSVMTGFLAGGLLFLCLPDDENCIKDGGHDLPGSSSIRNG